MMYEEDDVRCGTLDQTPANNMIISGRKRKELYIQVVGYSGGEYSEWVITFGKPAVSAPSLNLYGGIVLTTAGTPYHVIGNEKVDVYQGDIWAFMRQGADCFLSWLER